MVQISSIFKRQQPANQDCHSVSQYVLNVSYNVLVVSLNVLCVSKNVLYVSHNFYTVSYNASALSQKCFGVFPLSQPNRTETFSMTVCLFRRCVLIINSESLLRYCTDVFWSYFTVFVIVKSTRLSGWLLGAFWPHGDHALTSIINYIILGMSYLQTAIHVFMANLLIRVRFLSV